MIQLVLMEICLSYRIRINKDSIFRTIVVLNINLPREYDGRYGN
jgi:hypothetical protein